MPTSSSRQGHRGDHAGPSGPTWLACSLFGSMGLSDDKWHSRCLSLTPVQPVAAFVPSPPPFMNRYGHDKERNVSAAPSASLKVLNDKVKFNESFVLSVDGEIF